MVFRNQNLIKVISELDKSVNCLYLDEGEIHDHVSVSNLKIFFSEYIKFRKNTQGEYRFDSKTRKIKETCIYEVFWKKGII